MLFLVSRCSPRFRSSYTPTICISNLLVSRFSIAYRRSEPSSAASATNPSKHDPQHKDRREALRLRYANDHEYREKIRARVKARYANDSEYREKIKARNSKQSPAARQKLRQQIRLAVSQQYHNDFIHRQRLRLRAWICYNLVKQELTWKTHEVELNATEVMHTCSGPNCGYERKLKLWMKRKESDPPLYDCFKCFTSEWVPGKVLPIGYEHVVFGSGEKIEPRRV
ncbi:uncharacterized protein M437DRAFT_53099 [Aureobasidium melanogenum CBS 110374]|uniref:Uncharacterized protein n=1 Tax=Aureobasidium melanogenum (strain CBS 110374) TaxID=1043003 RepID=A0A074WES9_AURM1|nr:uncharacterized protein M437DRAFT_53099 [Aureobasidium melanogenum CBS 110374]KEQ61006.1 hypothetical protein M437DRAFT_53099 [Aureobasidium melanogenum CBS 110374]